MSSNSVIQAKVQIQGVRPFLWHHFTPDALPLEKQERTGVAGNDPEEWRKTVLMLPDRRLYIEPTYVTGCLGDAARFTKRGRGTLQSTLRSTLQIMETIIPFDRRVPDEPIPKDPASPVYMDIRGVVNPNGRGGGSRNVRYRIAASPGWQCNFTLAWQRSLINEAEVQKVVEDAGLLVGLGDGRKIGFGRFEMVSFNVE